MMFMKVLILYMLWPMNNAVTNQSGFHLGISLWGGGGGGGGKLEHLWGEASPQ